MKKGKRLRAAVELVSADLNKFYSLNEAMQFISDYAAKCKAKFDETVEVVFKLGVDPKHSDQMVRGAVAMPCGLGKNVRVAAFVRAERVEEAKKAGADLAGSDDLMELVKAGKLDFDVCVATPDMMGQIASLGKILGPKGLMPNPKLGTVADDVVEAIKAVKSGKVEYKTEKAGLIQAGVGKVSFSSADLKQNIIALYQAVLNAKPSASKGIYMQEMFLSTTQGPSLRLDLKNVME